MSGCIRSEDSYARTRQVVIYNRTDKPLLISGGIGDKFYDLLSNGKDVAKSQKYSVYPSKGVNLYANISARIYNLHDTTTCYYFYEEQANKSSFSNSLLLLKTECKEEINNYDIFRTYIINVDSEVLGIMDKDYTMIEKFPEYYSEERK